MSSTRGEPQPVSPQPMACQIRVEGHLDQHWTEWFEGLTITPQAGGETLLSGLVADQTALHGLLKNVRDLGLPLLSVVCVRPGHVQAPAVTEAHQTRSNEEN